MFSGDNTPSWFKHASRRTTLDHSTENSLASLPLDTCRRLWWQLCPSALTEDMALTLVKDLTLALTPVKDLTLALTLVKDLDGTRLLHSLISC